MQLAVITDEISDDVEHALDVMAEYDVRAAEFRRVWDSNIVDAPDETIDRLRRICVDRGVQVAGIASPFYKCDLSSDSLEPTGPLHSAQARGLADQLKVLNRSIEIAQKLEAPFVRVFSFWKRGALTDAIEGQIVDRFAEPAAIAHRAGVTLLLENESSCFIGTGAQTARVLEKINSPAVRAVWDPGNAFDAGEQPYPSGYEALKPFIAHVHAKDAVYKDDGKLQWVVVGEGECKWPEQFAALKRDGYQGLVSLETHSFDPAQMEAVSRRCLENMRRFMGQ